MTMQIFGGTLIDNLRRIVKDEHYTLLSTINVGLVLLFWSLGNKLNEFAQDTTNGVGTDDNFVSDFSRDFEPIFGSYVSVRNLTLMRGLADKCSLETIGQIAAAINWNYVPYLLNIEDERAYLFYMRLIHTKSLSPDDFNKEITAGTFNKKSGIDNPFLNSYSKLFCQNTIELYFGQEYAGTFRKFFEPKSTQDKAMDSLFAKKSLNKNFYQTIYQLIQDSQFNTQYLLNLQFNTLLWEVGNEILADSSSARGRVPHSLIEQCIRELHKDFPSIFNNSELPYCVKFAQAYKDSDEQEEIAEAVSWDYIKLILEVSKVNKQLFIANEVLANGITIQDLKGLISNGCFDFMARSEPLIKYPNKTPPVKKETQEDNVVVELTEHIIEPKINPKSDVNRNIFQNETLLGFISANNHLK